MGASAVRARAIDCAVVKAYYYGRERARTAEHSLPQAQAVQQTGFFRTLRFEEYVGGSLGRAPKTQT